MFRCIESLIYIVENSEEGEIGLYGETKTELLVYLYRVLKNAKAFSIQKELFTTKLTLFNTKLSTMLFLSKKELVYLRFILKNLRVEKHKNISKSILTKIEDARRYSIKSKAKVIGL